MLAAFNLQSTFATFSFYNEASTPKVIGLILAVLFAVIILGGAKQLTKVTGFLVPVMGIIYVLISLVVLVMNAKNLGTMFGMIFSTETGYRERSSRERAHMASRADFFLNCAPA